MKILMLNGSPRANGNTALALKEMADVFAREGIETELIQVGNRDIRGCIACERCGTLGRCVFDDLVNELAPKFQSCDGLVVGSPVYYASANATLMALLTRLFYSTPFDKTMKVGAGIVAARRGGASAAFDELNKFYNQRNACGLQPILEQRPRPGSRRGGAGCGGTADHAHAGPQYGLSGEEHRSGPGRVRPAGAGRDPADQLYPLTAGGRNGSSYNYRRRPGRL